MRKLNSGHEVWYNDGHTKMSKTLKELSKAVKKFEDDGIFVQEAAIQQYTENEEVYYTGIIVVVGSL